VHPQITEQSAQLLIEYYTTMRKWGKSSSSNVVTATTRQLESMIRLSEAHAKMRFSETVDEVDVIEAHRLICAAMHKAFIDPKVTLVYNLVIKRLVSLT